MSKITIPPAALEAGTDIIRDYRKAGVTSDKIARAAFLAMLEAWQRALEQQFYELTADGKRITFPVLILPLPPQEDSDE